MELGSQVLAKLVERTTKRWARPNFDERARVITVQLDGSAWETKKKWGLDQFNRQHRDAYLTTPFVDKENQWGFAGEPITLFMGAYVHSDRGVILSLQSKPMVDFIEADALPEIAGCIIDLNEQSFNGVSHRYLGLTMGRRNLCYGAKLPEVKSPEDFKAMRGTIEFRARVWRP